MLRSINLKLDIDYTLYILFCAYSFSMPFELILEQWFSIKTIFKPFRILSILIIALFFIRVISQKRTISLSDKGDVFLYLLFLYGLLVSLLGMITGLFNVGIFFNAFFQNSLYLLTFFVFKALPYTIEQGLKFLRFFIYGILANAFYIIFQNIVLFRGGRLSGFVDNPNYVALGVVAVNVYFLLKLNQKNTVLQSFLLGGLVLAGIFALGLTGSRTGFLIFVLSCVLVFMFSQIKQKLILIIGVFLVSSYFIFNPSDETTSVGPRVIINRLNRSLSGEETDVRVVIWKGAFRMLEDLGYHGLGVGQFRANFSKYHSFESNKLVLEIVNRSYFLSTHSDYIAILVDYGLPGLLFYILFLLFALRKLFLRINYPVRGPSFNLVSQYSFIILICLIFYGLTAENFQHHLYWFLLMFSTKTFN